MGMFSSLRRDQKEAISLLQVGTFLEYFDLMIYVHMAVLLNELFFPKSDPHTTSLMAAFAFCSTYVMRPVGALLFGFIGDRFGRKVTVVCTTFMMATSCVVMANLPTYAQLGITAAWIVTLCRVVQGLSSIGERIGVEVYLTETTSPPTRYPVIAITSVSVCLGTLMALMTAFFVTSYGMNWRLVFWVGAIIALVGTLARTRLRETPDFVDMKRRIKKTIAEAEDGGLSRAADILKKTNLIWKEKINKKTAVSYFLIACGWPACFYFAYIHCGMILKHTFGYTTNQIIFQNFIVAISQTLCAISFVILACWFNPLRILKVRLILFLIFILACPFALAYAGTPNTVFLVQSFTVFLAPVGDLAAGNFIIHFPIFSRFTTYGLLDALSRAVMYVATAFGLVYLTESYSHWGLWFIMLPIVAGFYWGLRHFERLESESGGV